MTLKEAVARYLLAVGEFGKAMPLGEFHLPQAELEAMLSAWDDDYHLHRYFELIPASLFPATLTAASAPASTAVSRAAMTSAGAPAYSINGAMYTAIVIQETVRDALK